MSILGRWAVASTAPLCPARNACRVLATARRPPPQNGSNLASNAAVIWPHLREEKRSFH
jgi:hypothetical protein